MELSHPHRCCHLGNPAEAHVGQRMGTCAHGSPVKPQGYQWEKPPLGGQNYFPPVLFSADGTNTEGRMKEELGTKAVGCLPSLCQLHTQLQVHAH